MMRGTKVKGWITGFNFPSGGKDTYRPAIIIIIINDPSHCMIVGGGSCSRSAIAGVCVYVS